MMPPNYRFYNVDLQRENVIIGYNAYMADVTQRMLVYNDEGEIDG